MSLSVEGFIVLEVFESQFALAGTFTDLKNAAKSGIVVEYHKPFHEAIAIGSIDDVIVVVGDKLVGSGGGANFQDQWWGTGGSSTDPKPGSTLARIKAVPAIGPVITQVLAAKIRITDLGINTLTSTYQFGFGFDFTNLNDGNGLELVGGVPIYIQALGAKITYQKTS